jgi:hypothetical protein
MSAPKKTTMAPRETLGRIVSLLPRLTPLPRENVETSDITTLLKHLLNLSGQSNWVIKNEDGRFRSKSTALLIQILAISVSSLASAGGEVLARYIRRAASLRFSMSAVPATVNAFC